MEKKDRKGLWIFGGLGCLWLVGTFFLAAIAIGYYIYNESQQPSYYYDDYYDYSYNDNANAPLTDTDGASLGFEIQDGFVSDDLYAYQVGAYVNMEDPATDWPAYRFTVDLQDVPLMLDEADTGSLWVGTILDNDYFVQVGMMSSIDADADGNMAWNYFWEMWDDQDVYRYGLQNDLAPYLTEEDPTFTLTCQDPDAGEWQFWVNDELVGKTYTDGSCSNTITSSFIFWEMTTDKPSDGLEIPEFGPYTLKNFEYWDGYDWLPVESATASYSYGRVVDGTVRDQASVCPPYGLQPVEGERAMRVGFGIECLEQDATIW